MGKVKKYLEFYMSIFLKILHILTIFYYPNNLLYISRNFIFKFFIIKNENIQLNIFLTKIVFKILNIKEKDKVNKSMITCKILYLFNYLQQKI